MTSFDQRISETHWIRPVLWQFYDQKWSLLIRHGPRMIGFQGKSMIQGLKPLGIDGIRKENVIRRERVKKWWQGQKLWLIILGKALTFFLFWSPKRSKTRFREKKGPQIIIFGVLNKKITTLRHFLTDGPGFGPWFLRCSWLFDVFFFLWFFVWHIFLGLG